MIFDLRLKIQLSRDKSPNMTDWVRKQIEAAKQRQGAAERKLGRRELDAQARETQRPALWDALREQIGNLVGEFNEGMSLSKPIQFTKKSDELFYVTKEDFPSRSFNVELQDRLNRIHYSLSASDKTSTPMQVQRRETFEFEVDEDGRVWFLLNGQSLKVDEVAELMLAPIFEAVA